MLLLTEQQLYLLAQIFLLAQIQTSKTVILTFINQVSIKRILFSASWIMMETSLINLVSNRTGDFRV